MRPVSIQLVVARGPLSPSQIAGELPTRRHWPEATQRVAARAETAAASDKAVHQGVALGLDRHRLHACAETKAAPLGAQLFMGKQGTLTGVAVGRKGLVTISRKTALFELQANNTLERAPAGLTGLQAQVVAIALEHGASLGAFKFGVLVHAAAQSCTEALQRATQAAKLAVQGKTLRAHANRHRVFGHRAIVTAKAANRGTQAPSVKKQRAAQRAAPALTGRVANATLQRRGPGLGAGQVRRHLHIIGAAAEHVGMQGVAIITRL